MTRPIPYQDICLALEKTVNNLPLIKEIKERPATKDSFTVAGFGTTPPNNMNSIGIGFGADKAKHKLDTFDTEEREYIFQVAVMFRRSGYTNEMIEKLVSLYSPLLKNVFRLSDDMICNIHKRDKNGEIENNNETESPIILDQIDLREIIQVMDIIPIFESPQGKGFVINLLFEVDEEDVEMSGEEKYNITQQILEVIMDGEKNSFQEDINQIRREGFGE